MVTGAVGSMGASRGDSSRWVQESNSVGAAANYRSVRAAALIGITTTSLLAAAVLYSGDPTDQGGAGVEKEKEGGLYYAMLLSLVVLVMILTLPYSYSLWSKSRKPLPPAMVMSHSSGIHVRGKTGHHWKPVPPR